VVVVVNMMVVVFVVVAWCSWVLLLVSLFGG
jgi:hypothetical protein